MAASSSSDARAFYAVLAVYCCCFAAMSLCPAGMGIAANSICQRTGSSGNLTPLLFLCLNGGMLVGGPFVGRLTDAYDPNSTLCMFLLGYAASICFLLATNWLVVLAAAFSAGFFAVGVPVCGNCLTNSACEAYRRQPAVWINLTNACFGVGATLAPLVVHFFVGEKEKAIQAAGGEAVDESGSAGLTSPEFHTIHPDGGARAFVAFAAVLCACAAALRCDFMASPLSIVGLPSHTVSRSQTAPETDCVRHAQKGEEEEGEEEEGEEEGEAATMLRVEGDDSTGRLASPPLPVPLWAIMPHLAIIGCGVGAEATFSAEVFNFALRGLFMDSDAAAKVNSTFYAVFALVRLICVPAAAIVPPKVMVRWSCAVQLVGTALMALGSRRGTQSQGVSSPFLCMAGIVLCGAGIAPLYAGALSLLSTRTTISGATMGRVTVAASVGAMAGPATVSYLAAADRAGPQVMVYAATLLAVGAAAGMAGATCIAPQATHET